MAVQIWTPTAPNADSSALAHAIAGAGASLGNALAKVAEEHKRNATQAKAVETFLSTLPPDKLPMDLQAFKNLSAKEKIGVGMGLLQGQEYQQNQQRTAMFGAQLQKYNQEMESDRAASANAAKSPAFLSGIARHMQPTLETMPAGVEGPPNQFPGKAFNAAVGAAVEETGFQPPPSVLARMLDQMGQGETGANGPLNFDEDPVSGSRFARTGKSVLPSGVNPSKQKMEPIPQYDGDENLIGHSHPTGGGKFTFRPLKSEGVTPDARVRALTTLITTLRSRPTTDNVKKAEKFEAELEGLIGGGEAKPGAAPGPATAATAPVPALPKLRFVPGQGLQSR